MPARRAACGMSARVLWPPSQPTQRRPSAPRTRRSIAAARSYSISCSQIARTSASNGSGRRPTRSHGRRRTERPISGSRAKRRGERPRVLVDPEREAHPRDSVPGRLAARRARAEQDTVRGGLGDADEHGLLAVVQQPLEHAPGGGGSCRSMPLRRGSRNGPRGVTSTRSSTGSPTGALR